MRAFRQTEVWESVVSLRLGLQRPGFDVFVCPTESKGQLYQLAMSIWNEIWNGDRSVGCSIVSDAPIRRTWGSSPSPFHVRPPLHGQMNLIASDPHRNGATSRLRLYWSQYSSSEKQYSRTLFRTVYYAGVCHAFMPIAVM